ncbi:hypothetical protein NQZ68_024536 [Dissostichus eleginoides]|nr:hypothetical protein NQZ68_024536 [Dissostichus eleginoides]
MRSFLLFLSLFTGCEASPEVKGCNVADEGGCKEPFNHTAYRTAKTTITCDEGNKEDSRFKFFCKENGSICEDILSTKSTLRSNGMFTLTETESGFTVSISHVSPQHAGVYWCGVESTEGSYRAALRKIQLEVKAAIKNFTRSPTIGQNMTYWCQYPEGAPVKKFICKGEDPSICEHVVSTAKNTERFSMIDETEKRNITITVRGVTKEDSGTYWCGAESMTETQSNSFFNRFLMTVVQPPTPTFPVITVIICVAALLLLLFVLILILIYTRFSKNKREAPAAQHEREVSVYMYVLCFGAAVVQFVGAWTLDRVHLLGHCEDYIYEEIQERPQMPDSGNAINTIYSTANFPTNPSPSLRYTTINFRNGSGEAAEVLMTNPSSSACDYSAVKDGQIPTCSNVNQPSPEDPLYSTVNKTQQQ